MRPRLERSLLPQKRLVASEGKTRSIPIDHRMPRRQVSFPVDQVLQASRDQMLSSAEFLAVPDEDVNRAQPVLVSVENGGAPRNGFKLPDGRVAIVVPFDRSVVAQAQTGDTSRASFPMASPNGKHVYMNEAQLQQALKHGACRSAILSAEFNAGYNPVYSPEGHPNDSYFTRKARV